MRLGASPSHMMLLPKIVTTGRPQLSLTDHKPKTAAAVQPQQKDIFFFKKTQQAQLLEPMPHLLPTLALLACAATLALATECGVESPTKASCATLYPWGSFCCSQYGWCGDTSAHCDAINNCQPGLCGCGHWPPRGFAVRPLSHRTPPSQALPHPCTLVPMQIIKTHAGTVPDQRQGSLGVVVGTSGGWWLLG